MNILFMCVANAARSQMAEGLAREILGPKHQIRSAGSKPAKVSQTAITVMKELGIDISGHYSKAVDDLPREFVDNLNYVITLCAEEVCPVLITKAKKLHWTHPDPAGPEGTEEERLQRFRAVRDSIRAKIELAQGQIFL